MKKIVLAILGCVILIAAIYVAWWIDRFQRRMDDLERGLKNPEVQEAISRAVSGLHQKPEEARCPHHPWLRRSRCDDPLCRDDAKRQPDKSEAEKVPSALPSDAKDESTPNLPREAQDR